MNLKKPVDSSETVSQIGLGVVKFVEEILKIQSGIVEAKQYFSGEIKPEEEISFSETVDVKAIRYMLGLSQSDFSMKTGIKIGTIKKWEQQIRQPERAAKILLLLIEKYPEDILSKIANLKENSK